MPVIRVVLADDQVLFRTMLEQLLDADKNIAVVAGVSSGQDAVAACLRYCPDVVLLDIQMYQGSGFDALRQIKQLLPMTKVAMLTTFEDVENTRRALDECADGYLVKDMQPEILVMAVNCIYSGLTVYHGDAYRQVWNSIGLGGQDRTKRVTIAGIVFDSVDIAIVKLISQGKTNREIAQQLNYSEGTVKNRVSRLLANTGCHDRTALSVFALKHQVV